MKEVLRKIMSIAMALIVLFSTMSFSVDMHYCGDHLVDFSIFENAKSCPMQAEMSKPSGDCSVMAMDMDCCTDLEVLVEGQDELNSTLDQLSFEQQIFVAAFIDSYVALFSAADDAFIPFKDYSPPPLIRDVQILDQTFLI